MRRLALPLVCMACLLAGCVGLAVASEDSGVDAGGGGTGGGQTGGGSGGGDDGGLAGGAGGGLAGGAGGGVGGGAAGGVGGGLGGGAGGGGVIPCGAVGSAWTCTADGTARERCVSQALVSESCTRGCLRPPPGTEAQCLGTTWPFSCTGSHGSTKSTAGDYYLTAFGCWVDESGAVHTDPYDNCIPGCLAQARSAGLCLSGETGPQCEQRITWFTADAARFGCLARVRVTNPDNGKAVIAVALDFGPSCSVERSVSFPVLDASGRINRYLFGADQGATDRSLVHVVEVDQSLPLGPVP